jgi:uncharacterized DUF497 family protein
MGLVTTQQFFWDGVKARENERKHGIAFEFATSVFVDPLALITHDSRYDGPEDRWLVVGMLESGVIAVVVCEFFEEYGQDRVRIISARKATLRERREYETGDYAIREPAMTEEYHTKLEAASQDDPDMKPEYDFSKGIRGKFANSRFPIYIENRTLGYFHGQAIATGKSSEELINEVLRQHVAATGYVPPMFAERR